MTPIKCSHCGKDIHPKVFSVHLRSHHDVDFYEYVCQHLDDFRQFGWDHCVVCNKVTKTKSKTDGGATCSRECMGKLRETWIGDKSPRFGVVLSDETRLKISVANKGNASFLGKTHSEEAKRKMSDTRIRRGLSLGPNNPMFGKTHTPEAIQKIMTHRPMNRLEKKVADELDRLGIKYTFQFFIHDGNVCKSYDFKIKDSPIILEVDGDFWHGNPDTKYHHIEVESTHRNDILKEKMASERGYIVRRLWESDIKKDISVVGECLKG